MSALHNSNRARRLAPPRRNFLTFALAAFTALALFMPAPVGAQAPSPVKQIQLTEKQVQGFISAHKDMSAIAERMQGAASDKPDPKIQAELEAIAKKHGFKDFNEYDDVAANISMVLAGIDPQSKKFMEPKLAIQRELDEVKADKSIPAKEKAQMLQELNDALKVAAPIQYPSNVTLVTKYFDKLEAVLQ
jgi:hypothetical protein